MDKTLEERVLKTLRGLTNVHAADYALKNVNILDVPSPKLEMDTEGFLHSELLRCEPKIRTEAFVIVAWRGTEGPKQGDLNIELFHASSWEELYKELTEKAIRWRRWRSATEPTRCRAYLRAQYKVKIQVPRGEGDSAS